MQYSEAKWAYAIDACRNTDRKETKLTLPFFRHKYIQIPSCILQTAFVFANKRSVHNPKSNTQSQNWVDRQFWENRHIHSKHLFISSIEWELFDEKFNRNKNKNNNESNRNVQQKKKQHCNDIYIIERELNWTFLKSFEGVLSSQFWDICTVIPSGGILLHLSF